MKEKIQIIDAPLVEGVITAAVECSMNKNIEEIKIVLKEMALNKI